MIRRDSTKCSLFVRLQRSRLVRWAVGILVALVLVLVSVSFMLDEPLRNSIEKKMNQELKGYSARLPGLHLRLLDLSVTLKGLTIIQQAHPAPAIAEFPILRASIHWREILSGRLVAEFVLDRPKININLQQLRSETANTVPLKEQGWQRAVQAIYPLKLNSVKIHDASVSYSDRDLKNPLVLSHLNLQASNIRNIRQPDQVYPSQFHLDTAVFTNGRATVDGAANFLAVPHPGINGHVRLENIALDHFKPIIAKSHISIQGGLLHASGDVEYASNLKSAHLNDLVIRGMNLDYIHSKRTAAAEKRRVAQLKQTAGKLHNAPNILIHADQITLTDCTLGLVNRAASRPYRLFISSTDLNISNITNRLAQVPAQATLKGKFMGSGTTMATIQFRPKKQGPEFDLYIRLEKTRLTTMQNLLRTYGDFDVSAGIVSLVAELHGKNNRISGYIKPFIKGVQVYDKRMDKDQGIPHQLYERLIDGAAWTLENSQHREVATKINISGTLGQPETSTWQIVVGLVKNAFFAELLPTFESNGNRGKRP